jgi:hypothetical protein
LDEPVAELVAIHEAPGSAVGERAVGMKKDAKQQRILGEGTDLPPAGDTRAPNRLNLL